MAHVRNEQMSLVAFLQAGSTSVYAGSWRHPATELRYLDSSYYADLGRLLERGCFDLMFFDDRLAMPGIYGGSVAEAVRYGARPVKLDLSVVLGVVAGATSRIGLGATYSTTYYAPYHVARTFATLDHLSGGFGQRAVGSGEDDPGVHHLADGEGPASPALGASIHWQYLRTESAASATEAVTDKAAWRSGTCAAKWVIHTPKVRQAKRVTAVDFPAGWGEGALTGQK